MQTSRILVPKARYNQIKTKDSGLYKSPGDWPRQPNLDGRKNKNRTAKKKTDSRKKTHRRPNRMAEFDETAEYIFAIFPTQYFKTNFISCQAVIED